MGSTLISACRSSRFVGEPRAPHTIKTKEQVMHITHGVPMAVKDLVAVKGIRSTWGSPMFADYVPAADEVLAARLRAAGGGAGGPML